MKLTDRQLRELLAEGAEDASPDADLLRRAADGELDADERERLLDQLTNSNAAADDYRLVRALQRGQEVQAQPSAPRVGRGLAVAAALLVAVAIGMFVTTNPPGPPDKLRGPPVSPVDGSALSAAPQLLDWTDVTGAKRYQVLLRGADGRELWRSPWVTESQLALPETVRTMLQPGQSYIWAPIVEAQANQAMGPNYRFSIEP